MAQKTKAQMEARELGDSLAEQGKFEEALPHLQTATAGSEDGVEWLNLATTAVMAKNLETGESAFRKALELQEKANNPSAMFVFFYTAALSYAGQFEKAKGYLMPLMRAYSHLGVTDLTVLAGRGMPPLANTIELALSIFKGLGSAFDSKKYLDDFAKTLDREGRTLLTAYRKQQKN